MRITNSMMSNSVLININRNAAQVNKLWAQIASTKKIQYPSDDPILASRSLKFRTVLNENEQYQRNVDQANSWMEVTDNGINKINDIFKKIRELVTDTDGIETLEDKQNIFTQIKSFLEEMCQTMNTSYAGRYIFSGFRTDEPGVFVNDDPTAEFKDITQSFNIGDFEKTSVYHKPAGEVVGQVKEVTMLKLAYKDCDAVRVEVSPGTKITAEKVKSTDVNAYDPPAGKVYYVEDTGELIFSKDVADSAVMPCNVEMDKTGFKKDELNPKVYFPCVDENGKQYDMQNQSIEYEFGVGTRFPVNTLGKDVLSANLYGDLMNMCDTVLNLNISSEQEVRAYYTALYPGDVDKINEAVKKAMDDQEQAIDKVLDDRINNLIGLLDSHAKGIATIQTDHATRLKRLDLIEERLTDDNLTYTTLLSNNEDTNIMEAAMKLDEAKNAYQASMQIGMTMLNISLLNFL